MSTKTEQDKTGQETTPDVATEWTGMETVSRREDLSSGYRLEVTRRTNGDILVAIDDGYAEEHIVLFRPVGASPRTWNALCVLFEAMRDDNRGPETEGGE